MLFYFRMETLIVAQYSADLTDLLDEVSMSASALGATLLVGEVTERTIADRTRGKSFDLVIFTGHGTESGYVLSDGELSPTAMSAYLRRWKAGMAILNCCYSWRWVGIIQRSLQIEVVAANTDALDDRDAWRAMEDILHGLRDGLSLQASADSSASHSFWGAKGEKREGNAAMTEYNSYIRDLEKTLAQLQLKMAEKDARNEARLIELEKLVEKIQTELSALKRAIESVEAALIKIAEKRDYEKGKPSPEWKINILMIMFAVFLFAISTLIFGLANGWWK